MPFGSDLCRMGFRADQAADVMRTVRSDQREAFLRNFETLLSLPMSFDTAVRAATWSVQDDWAAITRQRGASSSSRCSAMLSRCSANVATSSMGRAVRLFSPGSSVPRARLELVPIGTTWCRRRAPIRSERSSREAPAMAAGAFKRVSRFQGGRPSLKHAPRSQIFPAASQRLWWEASFQKVLDFIALDERCRTAANCAADTQLPSVRAVSYFTFLRSSGRNRVSMILDRSMSPVSAPTLFCTSMMRFIPSRWISPSPQ
jgi:hypothetical protein